MKEKDKVLIAPKHDETEKTNSINKQELDIEIDGLEQNIEYKKNREKKANKKERALDSELNSQKELNQKLNEQSYEETQVDIADLQHDINQEKDIAEESLEESKLSLEERLAIFELQISQLQQNVDKRKKPKKKDKKKSNSVKSFETNKQSFATGLNFFKLFWVFFIGCFVGVVVEICFCLIVEQHFEWRQGVIYGPFNPVYGFGAVCITVILYFLREKRDLWIFIGGSVIGGAFEWLCSYVQEAFTGTISWDYSDVPFNIGGRTCLLYSLFWGFLAIVWLKFIYPFMSKWIEKIPNSIGRILSWILVVFMIANMGISAFAVNRMQQREKGVKAETSFARFLDKYYDDEMLTRVYPNMRNPQSGKKLIDKAG